MVAYLVGSRDGLTSQPIREHLRRTLPDYMVPAGYVWLGELPLTPSGKTDRRKLQSQPLPINGEVSRGGSGREPPATEVERRLAEIWQAVLGRGSVGRTDNFFQVGGHSLLAMRMVARVREQFGIDASVADLFSHPVLADLAAVWAAGHKQLPQTSGEKLAGVALPKAPEKGLARVPSASAATAAAAAVATPAQTRLWFLQQYLPESPVYHVPFVYRLRGPLHPAALAKALESVAGRHPSLRTTFELVGTDLCAPVSATPMWPLAVEEATGSTPADLEADALHRARACMAMPIDLERGPPVRGLVVRMGAEDALLVLVLHHIVCDGGSLPVLHDDLALAYTAALRGVEPLFPEPAGDFASHAAGQAAWLESSAAQAEADFWRATLADVVPGPPLPTDRPRPQAPTFRGSISRSSGCALPTRQSNCGLSIPATCLILRRQSDCWSRWLRHLWPGPRHPRRRSHTCRHRHQPTVRGCGKLGVSPSPPCPTTPRSRGSLNSRSIARREPWRWSAEIGR